jgi:hypothetical protein
MKHVLNSQDKRAVIVRKIMKANKELERARRPIDQQDKQLKEMGKLEKEMKRHNTNWLKTLREMRDGLCRRYGLG